MASDISTYMAAFDNRQQLLAGRGWQVARDRVPTRVVYIGGDVTTNVAVAEGGADFQATLAGKVAMALAAWDNRWQLLAAVSRITGRRRVCAASIPQLVNLGLLGEPYCCP